MILAETVGPYTIGLAVVVLAGLPVAARYLRRAVSLEAGPLKATLGEIKQDAREAAEAAKVVGQSIGESNGAGSVQTQLAEATRASQRAEEATANIQHLLTKVFAWQEDHGEADLASFHELNNAVVFLKQLIGEPSEGDLQEPLIPYMHRLRHEAANLATKDRMMVELQHQTLVDAMAMLKEMRARIEDAAGLAAGVATNLAEAQHRADEIIDGEPGEAADAGAQGPKT